MNNSVFLFQNLRKLNLILSLTSIPSFFIKLFYRFNSQISFFIITEKKEIEITP
jgi:hypothetical protein